MTSHEKRCLRMVLTQSIEFWNKACGDAKDYQDKVLILGLIATLEEELREIV